MKQKILVVDDDAGILNLLQTELASEFEILTAQNGEQGLLLSLQHKPYLIISDIKMPELNGWEFCYLLRQIPSTKTIPFVFLSSKSDLPDRIHSLRLGADDFIAKPFTMEVLLTRIRIIFERVRRRQIAIQSKSLFEDRVNTLMIDLLEYLRAMRRSGIVEFVHLGQRGAIILNDGQMVEAEFEELKGKEAIRAMIQLEKGEVGFKEKETLSGIPIVKDWVAFLATFLPEE
ncbi:response regulator [bacterium]|nr:response regulator [bacterium]